VYAIEGFFAELCDQWLCKCCEVTTMELKLSYLEALTVDGTGTGKEG